MPQELTPTQALEILDKVSSLANLSREDHVKIQQASQTLSQFIIDNTPKAKDVEHSPTPKQSK